MRPDRATVLNSAPLVDLIVVLLRQYKRLLAERGIELTEAHIRDIAQQAADRAPLPPPAHDARAALVALVEESVAVLARWQLTYPQALKTTMNEMPGWETTSEFLEIANEKGNAEMRIASGAALVAALGDLRFADYLLATIDHDPAEIDAVVARRILLLLSGVDGAAADWRAQITAWLG